METGLIEKKLAHYIKRRGYLPAAVARGAGVSTDMLYGVIRDGRPIKATNLLTICEFLEVNVNDIVAEELD